MLVTRLRLSGFELAALDINFHISKIRLLAGGEPLGSTPAIAASMQPSEGVVADLLSESVSSGCAWVAEGALSPGFYIDLEFASAVEVDAVVLELPTEYPGVYSAALFTQIEGRWVAASRATVLSDTVTLDLSFFAYSAAILADGPSVYVRANESSGNAIDVMGGPAFGVAPYAQRQVATGFLNERAGVRVPAGTPADYRAPVYAPNASIGRMGAAFSLSFLIEWHLPSTSSIFGMASKELTGSLYPEWALDVQNGGIKLTVYGSNAPAGVFVSAESSPNVIKTDELHNLTITRSGTRYCVYVDGSAVIDVTRSGSPWAGATILGVGGRHAVSSFPVVPPSCTVSDIAIFPYALTQQQVQAHTALKGGRYRPKTAHGALPLSVMPSETEPVEQVADVLVTPVCAHDAEFGGRGCIYGTVELYAQAGNIPLPRRVRLHRSRDGLLVRETWSDAQGNYRFDGITDRYKYDVIAWDHEGMQRSVVANDLAPGVMP
ncbi:LamG-like jellyroll fold domain-containing protein [Comamonas jiangduensis]|uniref:LamG-like jellyroll fold domain-containing protein n=1 Tax=Comamonas jiangduensis TaxID=1194168 RepID=UPI003BF87B49